MEYAGMCNGLAHGAIYAGASVGMLGGFLLAVIVGWVLNR